MPEPAYDLTPAEVSVMQAFNVSAMQIKATIYDLNERLTAVRAQLEDNARQFHGALLLLGNVHGMSSVKITPDFRRITPDDGSGQ